MNREEWKMTLLLKLLQRFRLTYTRSKYHTNRIKNLRYSWWKMGNDTAWPLAALFFIWNNLWIESKTDHKNNCSWIILNLHAQIFNCLYIVHKLWLWHYGWVSMSDVSKLAPQEVFRYFKEISDVPRSSSHNEKISAYLVNFRLRSTN